MSLPIFPFNPTYPLERTYKLNVLVSEGDSGVEQRRAKWSRPKQLLKLKFSPKEKANAQAIVQFWLDRNGPLDPFLLWDDFTDKYITVRFASDNLETSNFVVRLYTIGVDLIEVF